MLVKHNLWDAKYHFKDNRIINYQGVFNYDIKGNVIIAKLKESASLGVIYITHGNVMKPGDEASIQCVVENVGNAPFVLQQLGLDSSGDIKTMYPYTKDVINYSGIYRSTSVSRQLRVSCDHHEEIKFKIYGLKIIEGKSNDYIYLPNISTLPEDKQPLLPPEGNYKEIQAL